MNALHHLQAEWDDAHARRRFERAVDDARLAPPARLARAARLTERLCFGLALELAGALALVWCGAWALRLTGLLP